MTTQSHPDNVVRWLAEAQLRIRELEHERTLLPKFSDVDRIVFAPCKAWIVHTEPYYDGSKNKEVTAPDGVREVDVNSCAPNLFSVSFPDGPCAEVSRVYLHRESAVIAARPKPVIVNLADIVSNDDEDAVTCELVDDTIVLDGNYPISLSRCDTPLKLLDWVHHLLEKEWGTPSLVRRFLALACETHGINFHGKA